MSSRSAAASRRLQREARAELRDARRQLERNLASSEWRRNVSLICAVVCAYFTASVGLTFFQKSLISVS